MNIIEALRDPALLGAAPAFRDLRTWAPWLVFLRAFYGLGLDPAGLALFRACTGRQAPRPEGYRECVLICGVQSGKSQVAAAVATFEALQAVLAGQRGLYVPLLAQRAEGAERVLLAYVKELFGASPLLTGEVASETSTALSLNGDVTVAVIPASSGRAIRGLRARAVILDELAFFVSSDGRPADTETMRAVRGRTATTGGRTLVLSSPHAQSGELWALYQRHFGVETSGTLIWQAPAYVMNPTLPADYLAHALEADPEGAVSEVEGQFRSGVSTLLDFGAIAAAVVPGVRERPFAWELDRAYRAHYDASGGRGDAAALAIGHGYGATEAFALDFIRHWPAPHNPETVIAQAASDLQRFNIRRVMVDHYAGAFPIACFARHGVEAVTADGNTSDRYLALVPLINAGRVLLLDNEVLLRELRGLERIASRGGKDKVDHRRGQHDDLGAAVSGAAAAVFGPEAVPFYFSG